MEMRKLTVTQLPDRLVKNRKGTIFGLDIKVHTYPTCQAELPLWNKQRCTYSSFVYPMILVDIHIFKTACVSWYTNLANQGENSHNHLNPRPPQKNKQTNWFCLCCYIWRSCGPTAAVPTASNSHPPQLNLITINSPNQNLCLTSIPISDHQLCEHWLRNNHLLNFLTSFLDKQAFELFFCLAVPVK